MKIKNLLYLIVLCIAPVVYADVPVVDSNTPPNKENVTATLANIAVPFAENRGQADAKVVFQAKTLAGQLFVTKDGELECK